jgi:hypothetical protein
MPIAIGHGLLRLAAQIERADHRAVRGVDHGRVRGGVAEDVDAGVEGIEQNAVRTALDVNRLDRRERLRIPHHDRFAAGKAVTRCRVDSGATRARLRDHPDWFERVEIEHVDSGRRRIPARIYKRRPSTSA